MPADDAKTGSATPAGAGYANGRIAWALRGEGLAALVVSVILYWQTGGDWLLFAVLFLWPDLAFLVGLADKRTGWLVYDLVHSYVGPLVLGAVALVASQPMLVSFALVWTAHIGADRLFGYGLRYPDAPHLTHLGPKGKQPG